MPLFRYEIDVLTNEKIEIEQVAYKNAAGSVLVLDINSPAPEGYSTFIPDNKPTYAQALQILTSEYLLKTEEFNKAFSLADMTNGVSQEAKQDSIRADFNALRAKYLTDRANLKTQYGA